MDVEALEFPDNSFDIVFDSGTFSSIELEKGLQEIHRVLKPGGVVIMRTPNFQKDWKGFYNDPTHVKPYTPAGLSTTLKIYGFKVIFCEPGLICKSKLYWKLPKFIKWHVASWIRGGTKSIMVIGEKPIS